LIHDVHATLVLIEDLHLLGVETRFVEELSSRETLIECVARNKIAETHLDERTQVAWRAVREVHDAARLAVDHEDVTLADISGFHGERELKPAALALQGPECYLLA